MDQTLKKVEILGGILAKMYFKIKSIVLTPGR